MKFLREEPNKDRSEIKFYYQLGLYEIQVTFVVQLGRRIIICIPTQIGCVAKCTFCVSGVDEQGKPKGYKRSLTQTEILEFCHDIMTRLNVATYGLPAVVCTMGEGEPFTNQATFEAWTRAFQALESEGRSFTFRFVGSTSGFNTDLLVAAADLRLRSPFKTQVSLHAARQEVRKRMVLSSRPVTEIVEATRVYRVRTDNGRVDVNCVCCAGADTEEDAHALGQMLQPLKGPRFRVKLNEQNSVTGSHWQPSNPESVERFRQIVAGYGFEVIAYRTAGKSVSGRTRYCYSV